MDESTFSLKLNGSIYTGWTEMSISRSLERMSGTFDVGLTGNPDTTYINNQIIPGTAVEVLINNAPVMIGYIDALKSSYDANRADLSIAGRDKASDLIDCAATVDGPFEYNGQRLDQILGEILKPYKIPVSYLADTGSSFKRIAIQPGETAFDFIERLCRYRSLLPISDGLGGLLITKPGTEKSKGKLVYGQNILTGNISLDNTERFSLIVVKGQEEGSLDNSASDVAGAEGRATDPLVTRYRPKVITGENPDSSLSLAERAKWELSKNRARSVTASYTVQGWTTDGQSDLWKINTIVPVVDPVRGLSRDMLIKDISLNRSASGTTTRLDLVLPEAFDLPAESEPDDDVLGGI